MILCPLVGALPPVQPCGHQEAARAVGLRSQPRRGDDAQAAPVQGGQLLPIQERVLEGDLPEDRHRRHRRRLLCCLGVGQVFKVHLLCPE